MKRPAAVCIAAILAMVTGCVPFSNNSTAVLWTDRPELAAYAEIFNAETEGRKVEVVYKETPWMALENETGHPDLVAGTRLDSVLAMGKLNTLDRLIKKEKLKPARFYQDLFDMGRIAGKCYLVPISFTLPVVAYRSETGSTISDEYIIPFEEMRLLGENFNVGDELPSHIGYSPRWQPEFLYFLSQLFGSSYSESNGSMPVWNDAKVMETVAYAADWVETTNGGIEQELIFETKYMYDPLYKLLDSGRILFNFMMIDEYLSVPAEVRELLDFRWLSDGKRVIVNDDVLFIGAPKQSNFRKTAEEFIAWLFTYDTQIKLLESAQFERTRSFGIAGGLSSITSVNTDALPRFYPFLHGHILHEGLLEFPARLPGSWERMRREVIIPWLTKALPPGNAENSLGEELAQWQLRQPELYR